MASYSSDNKKAPLLKYENFFVPVKPPTTSVDAKLFNNNFGRNANNRLTIPAKESLKRGSFILLATDLLRHKYFIS